ncbi:MAG TPA: YihY family inner membrane protein [Burkholderiaceae bacterium]|nr:YihY family inner membrane protein [Burkholderiaceae bacterium]
MKPPTPITLALDQRLPDLVETLQTWPWLDTLRTLRARFREDRLGLTASSLTFTTLISLVPLLTVMLAVFSAFPMFASFQEALQKYFLQTLVPGDISTQVLRALNQFAAKAKGVGSIGLVFLVLAALALMLTIDRTLNAIWRVRAARPIAQRVLVYWAAATLGPLVLGVSLSLTSYAVSASQGLVSVLPGGVALLLALLEFGLLVAAFAGLFHYVPNVHVRWRHAFAGGAFSAVGIEIAKRLLGWYVQTVPTYTVIYGTLAAVPIFLIWIYLAWVIVLLGAVVAAYAPSLQMRVKRWPDGPGARLQLALAVLRELTQAQAGGERGRSGAQLAAALRADPLQIEPVLETLMSFDWVGLLAEASDPRFVLMCDPSRTPAKPLLALMLIAPTPESRGLWQRAGFDALTLQELLAV